MPEHPLFPPLADDEDGEVLDVGKIHVTRVENGAQIFCPHTFEAEELQSLEQIHQMFGGGSYVLVARGPDNRRVIGARKYQLPGASRPLSPDDSPQSAPAPAALAPVLASGGGGGGIDANTLIVAMMQQNAQTMQAMMQMSQSSSQQTIALVTSLMQGAKQDAQAMIQATAQLSQASTANQGELFKAMLASRGSGGSDAETFVAGMQMAREMGGQMAGESGGDDAIMAIIQGFMAAKTGAAPPGAPGAASPIDTSGEPVQ